MRPLPRLSGAAGQPHDGLPSEGVGHMPRTGRITILTGSTLFLTAVLSSLGCQSSGPALSRNRTSTSPVYTAHASGSGQFTAASGVLAQRSRVAWSITSGQEPSRQTMKGEDTLSSDG